MTLSREFLAILGALDIEDGGRVRLGQLESLLSGTAIDWALLRKLLLRHRVLALFVSKLRAAGLWDLLPAKEGALLEKQLRLNQLRQLSAIRDLIEVAQALGRGKVEFLCLKGPVLGVLLYKDPVLRHFSDLDILVRPEDIAKAVAVLIGLGFKLCDLEDIQARDQADPMWRHLYHVHLKRDRLSLELHWRLSRNDRLYSDSIEQVFAQKQVVPVGGSALYTLGEGHLGEYIALHGSSHCWNRLKWLYDGKLYGRARRPSLSCSKQSKAAKLMQSLYQGLWQKEISQRMQVARDPIATLCLKQLLSPEEYPGTLGNMLRRTRVLLSLYPSLRVKAAYLGGLLVWPEVYQRFRLPPSLAFLYRILGPLLWLKEQWISKPSEETTERT